jgi:hypothetical protein
MKTTVCTITAAVFCIATVGADPFSDNGRLPGKGEPDKDPWIPKEIKKEFRVGRAAAPTRPRRRADSHSEFKSRVPVKTCVSARPAGRCALVYNTDCVYDR